MNFTKLVPSVFYADILDGIKLFVECLQFAIEHKDLNASQPFCVLQRDGISIMLFQDEQLAKEHYPELRLETKLRNPPERKAQKRYASNKIRKPMKKQKTPFYVIKLLYRNCALFYYDFV
jgi:hypothetical protein